MATLDLITVAEAKTALNIPAGSTTHDTELGVYVTAVSLRLDDLCGPIVIRTVTDEAHDGGRGIIFLKHYPVVAVSAINEYAYTTAQLLAAETNAAKTAYDYRLTTENGMVHRRASGSASLFPTGSGNVVVTYTAGRFANTAAVDARFKLAASICVAHIWRNEQGFATIEVEVPIPGRGYSLPKRALELLGTEVQNEVAIA